MSTRPDVVVDIRVTALDPDRSRVSFFELSPLLRSLRTLVSRARALRPSDMVLDPEGIGSGDGSLRIAAERLTDARAALLAARATMHGVAAALSSDLADVATTGPALLASVDATIDAAADASMTLMAFGLRAGVGEWYARRGTITGRLVDMVAERVARWHERRSDAVTRLADYDLLPPGVPDEERFMILETIERLVADRATMPRLATPALARAQVGVAVSAFQNRLDALSATIESPSFTLASLRASVAAELPLDAFDVEPFTLAAIDDEILRFLGDLSAALDGLVVEIDRRADTASAAIDAAAELADAGERAEMLAGAAKALFGEDFTIVPFFDVPDQARAALSAALAHTESGDLLRFQQEDRANRAPVDTWLYGVARVRERLRSWEQVAVMSEGFGRPPLSLLPLQLAALPVEPWLAVEFPSGTAVEGEVLCYTAHCARPFDPSAPQCGILIDEWPEVLPSEEQTVAVTFQFDRPNAEPPQCWLLVTPSRFGEGWSWDDVVEGVRETFERVRRRTVEPAHLDATPYARFLPATVMATTLFPIAIATDLARNNGLLRALAEEPHA